MISERSPDSPWRGGRVDLCSLKESYVDTIVGPPIFSFLISCAACWIASASCVAVSDIDARESFPITYTAQTLQQLLGRSLFCAFYESFAIQVFPVWTKKLHEQLPTLFFIEWLYGIAFSIRIIHEVIIFPGSNSNMLDGITQRPQATLTI